MSPPRLIASSLLLLAAAGGLLACGSQGNSVARSDPTYNGSVLFAARCSGCHSLDKVGTQGSGTNVRDKQRINGPNFNVRKETLQAVLYAIRNGGFSGAIMPQDIVVGQDAQDVAAFVVKYAGQKAKLPPGPTVPSNAPPAGQGAPGPANPSGGAGAPSGSGSSPGY